MGDTPLHRAAFTGRAVSLLYIQVLSILQASCFVFLCTNDPFRPIYTQQQFFFYCTVHLVYSSTLFSFIGAQLCPGDSHCKLLVCL